MRKRTNKIALICVMVLTVVFSAVFMASCGGTRQSFDVKVYQGETEVTTLELGVGSERSVSLTAKAFADETENEDVDLTWTSSNTEVATVNQFGAVMGVALGDATITIEAEGGSKAEVAVSVVPTIAGVKDEITLLMPTGESETAPTEQLTPTVDPEGGEFTYAVADTAVATVSDTGLITAVSKGETTLTTTVTASGKTSTFETKLIVDELEETATLNFTVDISKALEGLGLTELPEYACVALVGDAFGWVPDEKYILTAKEGSKTIFEGTITLDLYPEVENAEGEMVVEPVKRDGFYKYILAGFKVEDGVKTFSTQIGWEAYNGSPIDNRPIFLNGEATINDEVTVFQALPGDPSLAKYEYTVTINLKLAEAVADYISVVGAFEDDYDLHWIPTGGRTEEDGVVTKGALEMTKVDELNYTITLTLNLSEAKTPEMKFTVGGDWPGSFGGGMTYLGTDATGTNVGGANDANMQFDLSTAVNGVITIDLFVDNAPAA